MTIDELFKVDDDGGISVASFAEIREALADSIHEIFDRDDLKINLDPSSPDGLELDLFAYAYSELCQNLQRIGTNMNPATSSGIFLDYLASIIVGGRSTGESDESLRNRILSASHYGYATIDGMTTYITSKLGAGVSVISNDSDKTDPNTGIPARSVGVYLGSALYESLGGSAVAQAIWDCKPAGIASAGDTSGVAKDSSGMDHVINFYVIDGRQYYLKISVTKYGEESLPADAENKIRDAVASWAAKEYTSGKDFILQRVIVPVFSIPGIQNVDVEVSADGQNWEKRDIAVSLSEIVSIPAENITVNIL